MQNFVPKENFFIGISLSNSANYDSSICVLDRLSNIILLDKFYFADDIEYFLDNSPYIKNSIVCATVAYDNRILEGKWRIHSKNYQILEDKFKINRNNWTNRIAQRCQEGFKRLKERNIPLIRVDINQLRQSYKLNSYFPSRTSVDCKTFQTALKLKFNLKCLPDNMLSASALESILCAIFGLEYSKGTQAKEIFQIEGAPVLERKFET
ncbi:hypothetical protein IJ670_00885 [bacterium]|nr:hypothetical protein [bacterium]